MIDRLNDLLGIGGQLLDASQQLAVPGKVRCVQLAMLLGQLLGHPVVLVEHVPPHIGTDRPGLDERDGDLPGAQLHPECIAQGFDRILRCVVGAGARCGYESADRGDEHQTPSGFPYFRQHRLRHRDLSDDVDVELPF
jgi:hypothetical protein